MKKETTTTLFQLLARASGLSHQEIADHLGYRLDTVKSWAVGRNPTPPDVIVAVVDLTESIDDAAEAAVAGLQESAVMTLRVTDNAKKAKKLGWPSLGAYQSVLNKAATKAVQRGHAVRIEPLR